MYPKVKRVIKFYPVTTVIVLLTTSIFLVHSLWGEYGNYSRESIIALGGFDKELVKQGEIWRLLTYTFGHMSSLHFIINIPPVLFLSILLEKYYKSFKFLLLFLATTIGAGISIYLFYQGSYLTLAGLSGSGYGFLGIFTFIIFKNPDKISLPSKIFILFVLIYSVYSAFFSTSSDTAVSGHIGGVTIGFVLAFIIYYKSAKTHQ